MTFRNPLKLAGLDRLEKNPRQAQAELLKLSRSIMENIRQAQSDENSSAVAEPLTVAIF